MSSPSAILLLAAGASSRWGRPKALLSWDGDYLVNRLAKVALATRAEAVIRVLGADSKRIAEVPAPEGVVDVFNPNWTSGMGNSIACGLRAALALSPQLKGILILPCDLPLVSTEPLSRCLQLVDNDPKAIVQSDYKNGAFGPPVAFGRDYFPELLLLDSDEGGRSIIQRYRDHRMTIPFPEARWDLDSAYDLEKLDAHLINHNSTPN